MFPSANNDNSDPFSYPDQSILLKPFLNEIIPNSKQEDPSLSFFHFPSPYIHYELELQDHEAFLCQNYELLLHQQPLRAEDTASETVKNMADSSKTEFNFGLATGYTHNNTEPFPGKRSCKRDRHSKINTAKGPRDRRMRLSLEVAREFFGLQDMLGCDKASKTVEWLLKQARPEIKKLARSIPQRNYSCSGGTKSASSTSDCEVVSGIDDAVAEGSKPKGKPFKKEKKAKQLRKPAFRPLAKDLREKARARARARTREKNWSRKLDESHLFDQTKTNDMNQVGSWSPFETGEESATQSQIMRPSLEKVAQIEDQELSRHQCHQVGIQEDVVDESLVIMDKWSQSSMLSYLHNNGIPQEQQFTDFQFFGKPWEAHSNQNLCQYGLSLGSTSFYEPSG